MKKWGYWRSAIARRAYGGTTPRPTNVLMVHVASFTLAILGAAQAGLAQHPRSSQTLTVCDVLAVDPTRFNGEVITVKGLLEGTNEGTWLVGECKTHLVTKGLAWGNSLSVSVDNNEDALSSWEKFGEQLKRLHANRQRDRVWVTINGRLETRASMDDAVVQMPYGPRRAGFGHMADAPAEIHVISVGDVMVERRPPDKTEK